MKIIICDDNIQHLQMIRKLIENYLLLNNINWKIDLATQKSSDVLTYLKDQTEECLFFLDIELEGDYTGLELGQAIKDHNPYHHIILVTSYIEYLSLTYRYKLAALDYIMKANKDTLRDHLHEVMDTFVRRHLGSPQAKDMFVFKSGAQIHSIPKDDILSFQAGLAKAHQVVLRSSKGQYPIYMTLNEAVNLHPDFYQADRSTVINLSKVKCIDYDSSQVVFDNDFKLDIARSKIIEAHNKFKNFHQNFND